MSVPLGVPIRTRGGVLTSNSGYSLTCMQEYSLFEETQCLNLGSSMLIIATSVVPVAVAS